MDVSMLFHSGFQKIIDWLSRSCVRSSYLNNLPRFYGTKGPVKCRKGSGLIISPYNAFFHAASHKTTANNN